MFKLFATLLLTIGLVACSATQVQNRVVDKRAGKIQMISSKIMLETCQDPTEQYTMHYGNFVMEARMVFYKNCMGFDELMVIAWPGEPTQKNVHAAQLLTMMWSEWKAESAYPAGVTVKQLKIEEVKEDVVTIGYYEVIYNEDN
jgi:hypothetical protein